jgi:hypothetical protein
MPYAPSGSNRNRRKNRLVTNQVKEVEMGGACSMHGDKRNVYEVLVGKPEGKRPLQRLRRRVEDNVKIDLRETRFGWYGLD